MAFEKLELLYCERCEQTQTCYGFTSQSFGQDGDEIIVNTDFQCSECGNLVETHIDVEPFVEVDLYLAAMRWHHRFDRKVKPGLARHPMME